MIRSAEEKDKKKENILAAWSSPESFQCEEGKIEKSVAETQKAKAKENKLAEPSWYTKVQPTITLPR